MYQTIQQQILDDAPWVFVNSVLQVRAARKEVKGFRPQSDADVLRHGSGVGGEIAGARLRFAPSIRRIRAAIAVVDGGAQRYRATYRNCGPDRAARRPAG